MNISSSEYPDGLSCPRCGSANTDGECNVRAEWREDEPLQDYLCERCGKEFEECPPTEH